MSSILPRGVHPPRHFLLEPPLIPSSVTTLRTDGRIEGYASLFGVEDQGRDIVMPGAFRACLAHRGARNIRMLFQHDPARPIGVWDDVREDARGLYVCGQIIADATLGHDLLALLKGGAIDGLSIGFRARRAQRDATTGQRRLYDIDLWEISIVTFPMLPGARVHALKSATAALPSARPRLTASSSSKAVCASPLSPRLPLTQERPYREAGRRPFV